MNGRRLGWDAVPPDALHLAEDLIALKEIRRWLDSLDPINVADELAVGRKQIRFIYLQVRMFERYAEQKLRAEFLMPVIKKNERQKRKTV